MSDFITVISDVHVGHSHAPWPDNFELESGNIVKPNKVQYYLNEYWKDFWSRPEVKQSQYIINMEESIEGYSPREHGPQDLMTVDLNEQVRAFKALIDPYIKDKIYLCVEGSQYHGSQDNRMAQMVMNALECKKKVYFGSLGNWKHRPTGAHFILTHKISSAMLYKVTALDRWSLYLSAIKSKIGFDPDCVISGHHHTFFAEMTPSRLLIQCPSWKLWHPIKDASRYVYSQPTIGGITLQVDKDKNITVKRHFYPLKHLSDAMLQI